MWRRVVLGALIVALALAIGAAPAGASQARERLLPGSALARCYSRCQALQLVDPAWCMQGCRCATGVEFCPPSGPWEDLQLAKHPVGEARVHLDWEHN